MTYAPRSRRQRRSCASSASTTRVVFGPAAGPTEPHAGTEFRRRRGLPDEWRCADEEVDGLYRIFERPDDVRVAVASRVCDQKVVARGALGTEQDDRAASVAHPVAVLLRGLKELPHAA